MTGNEHFMNQGEDTELTLLDFWQYQYSNPFFYSEYICEFLVAQALGIKQPTNTLSWTLYDIDYQGVRIEVKMTAYYHPELDKISETRTFSIRPTYDENHQLVRQNDIYVFALSTGRTEETANPLELSQWEFYVVPTSVINQECAPEQKTLSLGRVRELAGAAVAYQDLKRKIDSIIK